MKRGKKVGRILVVDDNEQICELVKDVVESWGHTVYAAAEGRNCLDIVARELPDIILLDVMLPKLDGLEVLRRLRARFQQNSPVGPAGLQAIRQFHTAADRQTMHFYQSFHMIKGYSCQLAAFFFQSQPKNFPLQRHMQLGQSGCIQFERLVLPACQLRKRSVRLFPHKLPLLGQQLRRPA